MEREKIKILKFSFIGLVLSFIFLFTVIFLGLNITKFEKDKTLNILFLATDEEKSDRASSDAIAIVHIAPKERRVVWMSIPRDTLVAIPGVGYGKITAVGAIGGPQLVIRALKRLLKIPIHYFVQTDFKGFQKIIDSLGGITVDVDTSIVDTTPGYSMYIPAGPQHFDGKMALNYVRYRHNDPQGDLGRIKRQQKLTKALFHKTLSLKPYPRFFFFLRLMRSAKTNLNITNALHFANFYRSAEKLRLETTTLGGEKKTIIREARKEEITMLGGEQKVIREVYIIPDETDIKRAIAFK